MRGLVEENARLTQKWASILGKADDTVFGEILENLPVFSLMPVFIDVVFILFGFAMNVIFCCCDH